MSQMCFTSLMSLFTNVDITLVHLMLLQLKGTTFWTTQHKGCIQVLLTKRFVYVLELPKIFIFPQLQLILYTFNRRLHFIQKDVRVFGVINLKRLLLSAIVYTCIRINSPIFKSRVDQTMPTLSSVNKIRYALFLNRQIEHIWT